MPAWGDRMCTPESRTKSVLAETVGSAVFSDSLDSYKTWPSSSCPPHPPYPPTPIFANPPSHTNTIIMQFKLHSILSLFLASNSLVAAAPYYYDGNHDDGSAAAAAAAAGGSAAAAAASCNRYRGYSRFEYYRPNYNHYYARDAASSSTDDEDDEDFYYGVDDDTIFYGDDTDGSDPLYRRDAASSAVASSDKKHGYRNNGYYNNGPGHDPQPALLPGRGPCPLGLQIFPGPFLQGVIVEAVSSCVFC